MFCTLLVKLVSVSWVIRVHMYPISFLKFLLLVFLLWNLQEILKDFVFFSIPTLTLESKKELKHCRHGFLLIFVVCWGEIYWRNVKTQWCSKIQQISCKLCSTWWIVKTLMQKLIYSFEFLFGKQKLKSCGSVSCQYLNPSQPQSWTKRKKIT